MTRLRCCKRTLYVVVLTLLPVWSCRETEPLPAHYRDLGTDDTVLLPTPSAWCDPAVAKGQADWPAFRKLEPGSVPSEEPEPDAAQQAEAGEIEGEIKGLIDDYNAAASEGVVDDWIAFFEEKEQEIVRPLLEASLKVTERLGEARKQLESKLPDAGQRIAEACDALTGESNLVLKIQKVTAAGDTEATADVSCGSRRFPIRFVVVDDAWYMSVPLGKEPAFASQAALDQALATAERWLSALSSGQPPAESVLQEVEAAAKAAKEAGAPPSGEPGNAQKPEEPPSDVKEPDQPGE